MDKEIIVSIILVVVLFVINGMAFYDLGKNSKLEDLKKLEERQEKLNKKVDELLNICLYKSNIFEIE